MASLIGRIVGPFELPSDVPSEAWIDSINFVAFASDDMMVVELMDESRKVDVSMAFE